MSTEYVLYKEGFWVGMGSTICIISKPTPSAIRAEKPSYTTGPRMMGPGELIMLRSVVAAFCRAGGEMELMIGLELCIII
jgi:hypothetical protein